MGLFGQKKLINNNTQEQELPPPQQHHDTTEQPYVLSNARPNRISSRTPLPKSMQLQNSNNEVLAKYTRDHQGNERASEYNKGSNITKWNQEAITKMTEHALEDAGLDIEYLLEKIARKDEQFEENIKAATSFFESERKATFRVIEDLLNSIENQQKTIQKLETRIENDNIIKKESESKIEKLQNENNRIQYDLQYYKNQDPHHYHAEQAEAPKAPYHNHHYVGKAEAPKASYHYHAEQAEAPKKGGMVRERTKEDNNDNEAERKAILKRVQEVTQKHY